MNQKKPQTSSKRLQNLKYRNTPRYVSEAHLHDSSACNFKNFFFSELQFQIKWACYYWLCHWEYQELLGFSGYILISFIHLFILSTTTFWYNIYHVLHIGMVTEKLTIQRWAEQTWSRLLRAYWPVEHYINCHLGLNKGSTEWRTGP